MPVQVINTVLTAGSAGTAAVQASIGGGQTQARVLS